MNKLNVKYQAIIKSRKKALWFSAINAILLLLVCYFADNLKYSVLSGPSIGQRIEQFREVAGFAKDSIPEDYVFINIAYDRELIPVLDEYGLPQGDIDITDRKKLTAFLQQLDDAHKFILMDVLLSDKYKSEADSALVQTLLNTDRISVSRSNTAGLIDERLNEKAGYTDYSTDIYETNFVKYEFINEGKPTMPYMAFVATEEYHPVYSLGPIHWSNWHFYWNSLTLRFPIKLWDSHTAGDNGCATDWQEKKILNLGADILDMGIDIPTLVKDKIVVIGDFSEDDIHDTYLGKIAGPVININALEALRNNELEIPWTLIIFLLSLYCAVCYQTIRQPISTNKLLKKLHLDNKFFRYILSFIGYSFLFAVISGSIYLVCGIDINILIPSLWFTFMRGYTNTFAS